jgi:5-hydroxyisourate hydrolase
MFVARHPWIAAMIIVVPGLPDRRAWSRIPSGDPVSSLLSYRRASACWLAAHGMTDGSGVDRDYKGDPDFVVSVSVQVINGIYGRPAAGVSVSLSRKVNDVFTPQWRERTDEDGRISLLQGPPLQPGSYELEFDLDGYFRAIGYASFNSLIALRFYLASPTGHYRLSLLITPASCIAVRED